MDVFLERPNRNASRLQFIIGNRYHKHREALTLVLAHSSGSTAHRMYLFASYLLAALCFPYIIVKTIFYHYSQDAIPASAILIITGVFCWVHVFAARHTAAWARRRFQMGLSGSIPGWEDPEETYVLKRPDIDEMTKNSDPRSYLSPSASFGLLGDWSADVAAESLADVDSRFIEVNGIRVHYKEVWPSGLMSGSRCGGSPSPGSSASSDAGGGASMGAAASGSGGGGTWDSGTGIVLVHGFGGGVFAWRHIMEALSLQCQCRVVAFDRPAFGELDSKKKPAHSSAFRKPSGLPCRSPWPLD